MRSESASHRYGEHRIYLSLAPGIGCTRRLMADAQLLAAQGYDVGIAFNASSDYLCDFARGLRPLPLSLRAPERSTSRGARFGNNPP